LLANRLFVLESALTGLGAGAPFEVALRLGVAPRGTDSDSDAALFFDEICDMYRGWAARCGMAVAELELTAQRALFVVSGLGASVILADESGLHIAERVEAGDGAPDVERVAVNVEVAGVPAVEPIGRDAFVARVQRLLDEAAPAQRVTRRYRSEPAPLVRDAVRNYRTGRLDRVLAGDFDLY
jgi:ATP-dependent Clp protease ATP-binding subunit ClpC